MKVREANCDLSNERKLKSFSDLCVLLNQKGSIDKTALKKF